MPRRRFTEAETNAINSRPIVKRAPRHSTRQGQRQAVRPRAPSETDECKVFIAWTKLVKFDGAPLFERVVKIPNERGKAGAQTAILTAIGMRAGFPDYDILAPAGPYHGLYLEAKRVDGGKIEDEQVEWRRKLDSWGYYAQICAGSLELIAATKSYFVSASQCLQINGAGRSFVFVDGTKLSA